jgi:hypothetical protein
VKCCIRYLQARGFTLEHFLGGKVVVDFDEVFSVFAQELVGSVDAAWEVDFLHFADIAASQFLQNAEHRKLPNRTVGGRHLHIKRPSVRTHAFSASKTAYSIGNCLHSD